MSSEIRDCDKNEEEYFREITKDRIKIISTELKTLTSDSKTASKKIKNLQLTVNNLKSEIQTVTEKIEQTVDLFRSKLSNKITVILNLLGEKNINVQSTADSYKIVSSLAETLSAVGYELDKDVNAVSSKVNFFDVEFKNISEKSLLLKTDNSTLWFIDGEGKLTKRNNTYLGSSLPTFKSGDKRNRQKFISSISNTFSYYEVPRCLWVGLAIKQLIGKYQRWWSSTNDDYKNKSWTEFNDMFVAAKLNKLNNKFSNNNKGGKNCYTNDENISSDEETIQKLLNTKINGSSDCNTSERVSDKFLKNLSKSENWGSINSNNDLYSEKNIKAGNDASMKLKAVKRKRSGNENEINVIEVNNLDKAKKSCTDK